MTGFQLLGLILLPVALVLIAFANEQHRDEHGVKAPSRKAMARIRRNARQKGVSTDEAYNTWLLNKQKQAGLMGTPPADVQPHTLYGAGAETTAAPPPSSSPDEMSGSAAPLQAPIVDQDSGFHPRPASQLATGGYVAGHFRKDGTWVKPHWRKPRGLR